MRDWQTELQKELTGAEAARARGNEGRARVCARRAAGIAARAYLSARGQRIGALSGHDILNLLVDDETLAERARQSARYLTLRVAEDFRMPIDVDLIEEARLLSQLLGKS
jgi:hypothetical protein